MHETVKTRPVWRRLRVIKHCENSTTILLKQQIKYSIMFDDYFTLFWKKKKSFLDSFLNLNSSFVSGCFRRVCVDA